MRSLAWILPCFVALQCLVMIEVNKHVPDDYMVSKPQSSAPHSRNQRFLVLP